MVELTSIPLSRIMPIGNGRVTPERESVAIITDTRQWSYAAEARFEIPGISDCDRKITMRIEMISGRLGIGWVTEDGSEWVARASAGPTPGAADLSITVPAGTSGGALMLDNWTEDGGAAVAIVKNIGVGTEVLGPPPTAKACVSGGAGELQPADAEVPTKVAELHFRMALAAEERGEKDAAIAEYKTALSADPTHVEAIAGLGRLRFIAPDQPFLDEVKQRAPIDVCEVVVEVRNPCNYRCFYCVAIGQNNVPVQRFNLARIDEQYQRIDAKVIVTSLECGGGEPTVHPQFPELVRICASHGGVSFPSNNSQNPERWLPRETASRILIRSALHPEAEPHIDRYLKNARYLIDAGCEFLSIFIAHPTRISQIPIYQELFARYGVPFTPGAFIGEFEGRSYPHAYTEEQKGMLGLLQENRYWVAKIEPHVTRIRNFRGIPCIAGHRSIYMNNDGTLRRCIYDPDRVLEAPLPRSEPCGVGNCGCGLFLDRLNSTQDIQLENYWGTKIGLPSPSIEWREELARRFGYPGSQEAMAAEGIRMYDALMSAYGKDEFPER